MLTTNIWWMNCFQESVHIVQKNMANITHFMSCYSQNINKKTTHFCHANLEKFVYKTVA